MVEKIKRFWNNNSYYYQDTAKIKTNSAHYGPYATNENKLNLLGNIKNKKILELGCGGGQCSIAFAKKGAKVTGLDLSSKQLDYAKNLAKAENLNIEFILKDIQNLNNIKSNSYDIAFSAFAFQYVYNLNKLFKEVNRVLKKNGLFVFSLDHPFYGCIDPKTHKIINSYNTLKRFEEKYENGKAKVFVSYFRKISEIYNSLVAQDFKVLKIIEPFDKKTEKAWKTDWWRDVYPLSLVEKITPTIIFKCTKK